MCSDGTVLETFFLSDEEEYADCNRINCDVSECEVVQYQIEQLAFAADGNQVFLEGFLVESRQYEVNVTKLLCLNQQVEHEYFPKRTHDVFHCPVITIEILAQAELYA